MKTIFILLLFFPAICLSQIAPDFKSSDFWLHNSIVGISDKDNLFVQSSKNLWKVDLNKGTINLHLQTESHSGSFDFTKGEKYIITENSDNIIIWKNSKKYKQWEIPKGVYRIKANRTNFNFALADITSNKVQIWNAEKGKLIQEFKTEHGTVQTLYYTEDGKFLIVGTEECEVIIYEDIAKIVKHRFHLTDCDGARGIVSISSDINNDRILLGIRHSETRMIDFNSGKQIKNFKSYGASTVHFSDDNLKFYEGTGIASINGLSIIDIEKSTSKKIKDNNSLSHYRNITMPKNNEFWIVSGDGIMFYDKMNNDLLFEIFFHSDRNRKNKDLWWNAVNYKNNKVGGSDTKYLLNNNNEISIKDEIFDDSLLMNFIKKYK